MQTRSVHRLARALLTSGEPPPPKHVWNARRFHLHPNWARAVTITAERWCQRAVSEGGHVFAWCDLLHLALIINWGGRTLDPSHRSSLGNISQFLKPLLQRWKTPAIHFIANRSKQDGEQDAQLYGITRWADQHSQHWHGVYHLHHFLWTKSTSPRRIQGNQTGEADGIKMR